MSAALLLITLVMYTGQLIRPAMVMARNTASASSWEHSKHTGHERQGQRGAPSTPGSQGSPRINVLGLSLTKCGYRKTYSVMEVDFKRERKKISQNVFG